MQRPAKQSLGLQWLLLGYKRVVLCCPLCSQVCSWFRCDARLVLRLWQFAYFTLHMNRREVQGCWGGERQVYRKQCQVTRPLQQGFAETAQQGSLFTPLMPAQPYCIIIRVKGVGRQPTEKHKPGGSIEFSLFYPFLRSILVLFTWFYPQGLGFAQQIIVFPDDTALCARSL